MRDKISLLKIVDFIFILLFLTFIGYFVVDFNNISKTLKETQKEKIALLINSQSKTYSSLLRFGFYDELKESLISLVRKNPQIREVKVISDKFKFKYPMGALSARSLGFDLKYKNKKIGKLVVFYTDKYLIQSFFTKYVHRFLMYFLFILPFFMFLWIYIRKKIKALNILAKRLEDIDFRETKEIKFIDNYYEINLISDALNKLLSQVNNFYIAQKNIIKKLIKYKKQLQSAQKVARMASWEYDCESKKLESLFKEFLGFKSANEIIDLLDDKEMFLKKLDDLCEECTSLEKVVHIGKYYIKIDAKCLKHIHKKIVIGTFIDITEEIKKQQRIEFLAYHDTLTGVYNRTFLKEELQYLANVCKRNNTKFALLYLDLDNFKMINDNFGHEIGDKVLVAITDRLKKIIRNSDILARIGGDEFVIVLVDIKNRDDVKKVIEKIFASLKEPVIVENKKFSISFSIGVAIFPVDTSDIDTLFKYADIAMYKAKKEGKNRYEFINDELKKEIKNYYEISNEIKEGLEKGEFKLYFQPKIDIVENRVDGAEGLIRWEHPTKGIIPPGLFIPVAESSSLIGLIDNFVLEEAFKTLLKWKKEEKLKNLRLSINLSAKAFKEDLVNNLKKLLEKYPIDPSKLEIEITETVSMENISHTLNLLKRIKDLGFLISIDDFGTGYSSLSYLKMLPFDIIKIDQSFVKDVAKDKDDYLITKMIVEVSKILNKINIAEGVENREILEIIKNLGCRYIQGYYFSKPLEENKFYEYVKNFRHKD